MRAGKGQGVVPGNAEVAGAEGFYKVEVGKPTEPAIDLRHATRKRRAFYGQLDYFRMA